MTDWRGNAESRAHAFAFAGEMSLTRTLGGGDDGIVFATNRNSAIKSFGYEELFLRERDVYLRLWELEVNETCGCHVPRLVDFSNAQWCIEMEIVQPPFVLDFAGASLDQRPDYPRDVLEDWQAEKEEQYGDDWPWVQSIIASFAGMKIFLVDVKPGNITLH